MDHTLRGRLRKHVEIAVDEYARLGESRSFDSVLSEVSECRPSTIARMSDYHATSALVTAIDLIAQLRSRCCRIPSPEAA